MEREIDISLDDGIFESAVEEAEPPKAINFGVSGYSNRFGVRTRTIEFHPED